MALRADGNRIRERVAPIPPASEALTTSVASSATSQLLLAANANRREAWFYNRSSQELHLSFTSPATELNSFVTVQPQGFFSMHQGCPVAAVYGIWAAADGRAQVTELE